MRSLKVIGMVLGFIGGLLPIAPVWAEYNANITGVITSVLVYPDSDLILIRLDNQPASHPVCNPAYFAISETEISAVKVDRLFSRVLTSYASGKPINIGYDNAGNCQNPYIRVHRIG